MVIGQRNMVVQMAARSPQDPKVLGSNPAGSYYRDKILSIEQAAMKSWSEYTTDELKLEKLIK